MELEQIIVALISMFGVVLSVSIGVWTTMKASRDKLISQSRNRWLDEMREHTSKMLALAYKQQNCFKSEEYYYHANQVLNRLNMGEPAHIMLGDKIRELSNCKPCNCDKTVAVIQEISRHIFKEEWEKVKKEAKGVKNV